jgi:DNA helicase-2/ATP-dependent DNA helicase PcrA
MNNLRAILKQTSKPSFPHVIIQARAGTGKTTTLIEALKLLKFTRSDLTPSEQQQQIMSAISQSRSDSSICFVAFNKSIAKELKNRVPKGCDAMTMHSMGYRAVCNRFDTVTLNNFRVREIIAELLHRELDDIKKRDWNFLVATEKLVQLCKMNLVGPSLLGSVRLQEDLLNLASHYDIDLNGKAKQIFALIPEILDRCMEVDKDGCIDYADMIWLPVVLKLPLKKYDLLLVDEAQDTNRCQQEMIIMVGRRIILCGDTMQAIYGFAGADSGSMGRMQKRLGDCIELPLTVTRRCGKAIVEEAKKYVPDFEAHESNCEGKVSKSRMEPSKKSSPCKICQGRGDLADLSSMSSKRAPCPNCNGTGLTYRGTYRNQVEPGDMILCRVNAPLISECFKFLKDGRKANIQGRDVGAGLIRLVKKLAGKGNQVTILQSSLDQWSHREELRENAKRHPSESRLIAIRDKADCIECFMEGQEKIQAVIAKIESVFTDDADCPGIRLSSVHKAKGLEAKRVFILQPKGSGMPHPMAKTPQAIEQEYNLLYVAITRAIEELVFVS